MTATVITSTSSPVINTIDIPYNPLVDEACTTGTLYNVVSQLTLLSYVSNDLFRDATAKNGFDFSINACISALLFEVERLQNGISERKVMLAAG